MTGLRFGLYAACATTLLSAQMAHAAPVRGIDPLVALSALGTAQSQSAVCAAGASAAAAGAAVAQAPAPGCVLPVTGGPQPVLVEPVPAPYVAPVRTAGLGTWPILLGLAALLALIAVVASGGDGDLTPASPN